MSALKELSEQADKCEANLVLMGIEPTYPSEKYGYIIPAESAEIMWLQVKTFKEKPDCRCGRAVHCAGRTCGTAVCLLISSGYVMNKAHELIEFYRLSGLVR